VYAAPLINACDFRGASTIGGSRSFVNGATNRSQWVPLVGHELGHAFGAEHANGLRCVDGSGAAVILSTTCKTEQYADPFDLMGSGFRRQPNANHKAAMGLLPAAAVQTVGVSGDYRLGPLETEGDAPRLVRVPYDRDDDGRTRYLLLEFRQPSAYDEFGPDDPGVNGVTVRLGNDPDQHAPTLLVDTTPQTATFADAPLLPQRALVDRRRDLSISVLDATADGATVHIDYGGFVADWATCDGTNLPSRIGRGRMVPVDVRFRNTGTTTWTAPDGYRLEVRGAQGQSALTGVDPVAPGAVGTFSGTITAPQQLGRTTIAWHPMIGDQHFGEECTATVDVVADPDPPTAPAGLKATVQSQSAVQLSWAASSDNVGVKGYRVARSTDGSTFTPLADVAATNLVAAGLAVDTPYWFRVVAYDAAGNVSPPSGVLRVQVGDITAPSAPANLKVAARGPGTVDLAWSPSTDNVRVERYRVFRRANVLSPYVLAGESTTPSFRDSGLSTQSYSYYVVAVDRVGNTSARSNTVSGSPQTCLAPGACF
jgi:hypothetical protein